MWKQPLLVGGVLALAAILMFISCSLFTGGDDNATVSAVMVSPAASTVAKGGTQTFTAVVAGTGNYDQTVTWTVRGGGEGTTISSVGVLTVAAGEMAADLTVTATSTMDASKSGTAAVTVTGGGLVLENNTTLTVNGTVNAKATTGLTSFGIVIMPGASPSVTINGSGIIHLTTQGTLLAVTAGQKLTLDGNVTLDGLTTSTMYPGTSTPYPSGIGGDAIDNTHHLVFVGGELDMQGGTITGNYNTDSRETGVHGGGVEVHNDGTFTMAGGTIYGSGAGADANTATDGASLYVNSGGGSSSTAKWGASVTTAEIGGTSSSVTGGDNIISSGSGLENRTISVSP